MASFEENVFTSAELADMATLRSKLQDLDVDGTLAQAYLSEVYVWMIR